MITNSSQNHRFKETRQALFDALVSRYYDWVLEYNKESGIIEFLHVSDAFLDRGILPEKIHTFEELNQFFADEMVVQEERDAYLEQLLKEPQYQKGYSVIYTNIKGFKAINDIIGT